ncbi:MAG: hypothetical protein AABX12_03355 [Nanoarchaeota archaeon]|mgnify:FL=1
MKNQRGFEFSFTWLFVILIGLAILFIALYVSSNLLETGSVEYQTRTAAELGALLHPLETSLASQASYTVELPEETRIYNRCYPDGAFGTQEIRTSVRSGLGKEWPRLGEPNSFSNKYLFSSEIIQGNKLHFFVLPLAMPYKVGDIIVLYDKAYCFVAPPRAIEEDIESLGMELVNVSAVKTSCPRGSVTVCFDGSRCDINVQIRGDGSSGVVNKNRTSVNYYGSLVYGAIFSEPELYDCQSTRLRKRAAQLAALYEGKSSLLASRGCSSGMESDLRIYGAALLDSRKTISDIGVYSDSLRRTNDLLSCSLF